MGLIANHKDLPVWQKSIELAGRGYLATSVSQEDWRGDLARQARQSAVSVASNIADAAAHNRRSDTILRLKAARAALVELETQILIAAEIGLLRTETTFGEELIEIRRLLATLIRKLSEQQPLCPIAPLRETTCDPRPEAHSR